MIFILFLFLLITPAQSDTPTSFSCQKFEYLPILSEGRYKPIISFAQSTLLKISGRRKFQKKSATKWLCQLLFEPETMVDKPLFLVKNPDILRALGLSPLPHTKRYSFNFFAPNMDHIQKTIQTIIKIPPPQRSIVEKQILALWASIQTFIDLSFSFQHFNPMPFFTFEDPHFLQEIGASFKIYTYEDIRPFIPQLKEKVKKIHKKNMKEWSNHEKKIMTTIVQYTQWTQQKHKHPFLICHEKDKAVSPWQKMLENQGKQPSLNLLTLKHLRISYLKKNQKDFNHSCQMLYQNALQTIDPKLKKRFNVEVYYHRTLPFLLTQRILLILMLLSFLLFFIPLKTQTIIKHCLIFLSALALIIYTTGIIGRVFILARPPVSTLYETFLFVGWVASIFSFFALTKKRTIELFLTFSITGLILQLIAHYYGLEGDTFQTVEAVLNNNFWLATHVLAVTTGYAGCFLAGIIGHLYTIYQWICPHQKRDFLFRFMIITLFIGWFFVTLGTILGGIWADQSWGRFWGWDPKENGALVIILTTAIVFHLYWDGVYGKKGLALGTIVVLMSVLIAWFGTNLLGVGLHSYGFTSGTAIKLSIALLSEVLFILFFAYLKKPLLQSK